MKIIHTADWHIGQNFYGYERYEEHRHFLDWLEKTLAGERADVLLVTGDVFDGPNPPARAQQLYYAFLHRVSSRLPHLQVVITAGNHDSAARLEAPNPLLEAMRIRVVGSVHYYEAVTAGVTPGGNRAGISMADDGAESAAVADALLERLLIPLYGVSGRVEAYCLAIPYLRQGDFPPAPNYGEGVSRLYADLFAAARSRTEGLPIIVTGHLHVAGAALSEQDRSERTVVGGLDCVPAVIFPPETAYGALGHLHRAQRVGGRDTVRYAGAPVPMSFAEKNNTQSVACVTIDASGEGRVAAVELLPYAPQAALLSLPDKPLPIEAVLPQLAALPSGEPVSDSPYLEIKVLMQGPDPTYRYKIEQALQGKAVRLTRIAAFYPEARGKGRGSLFTGIDGADDTDGADVRGLAADAVETARELSQIPPLAIAADVYERKYGVAMPESLQKLMNEVIKEVEA